MNINHLIYRNLKKNIRNYYLYVFALIFSVALYFAFVTLQYDPAMDEAMGSIKGAASIRAASILLVAIVGIFLLYANKLFIKRRSKEIGLFQLIGMTKGKIFQILSIENFILYFGSLLIGISLGFVVSKLTMMILFKITGVLDVAHLNFSSVALLQTIIVFAGIYLFILLVNFIFIKRQSILSLFRVQSTTEGKAKRLSFVEITLGILGIGSITFGYILSSKLFSGDFGTVNELFLAMISILGSVIIGTYLFYKGSVSYIFHLFRKKKDGYLNLIEVLSLSSIMFRMKSNALLLTIITTVSALAIGLLSLSYISYYSAGKTAKNNVPHDFSFTNAETADQFIQNLETKGIPYDLKEISVIQAAIDISQISESDFETFNMDPKNLSLSVISDQSLEGVDVPTNETIFTGKSDLLQQYLSLKEGSPIELKGDRESIPLNFSGFRRDFVISWYFTEGGLPTVIVDQTVYEQIARDLNPDLQKSSSTYIGIDIKDEDRIDQANNIFKQLGFSENMDHDSQLELTNAQKMSMGLIMFIVGFLGLAFLMTSGYILYFKQMDEGEEERSTYTILRKLGFTQTDLLSGIIVKQLFSFGIPLFLGLSHSYFAIQSGWFLFGAELWTPMIMVMVVYTGLYSIFGILSVQYYKKVIKEAL